MKFNLTDIRKCQLAKYGIMLEYVLHYSKECHYILDISSEIKICWAIYFFPLKIKDERSKI